MTIQKLIKEPKKCCDLAFKRGKMDASLNKINWDLDKNTVLMNPRILNLEKEEILRELETFFLTSSHFWIATSGSTGPRKWIALSKKAILASAKAVNEHLSITPQDRWINPLPIFHVGGLGILARAYLTKSPCFSFHEKWDARVFHRFIQENKGSITALVPTQVYDLVIHQLKAPSSLRTVIVGGGVLNKNIYKKALDLGWPLYLSYGMTECSSQIATSLLNNQLRLLPHIEIKFTKEGLITLKSPALLTGYASQLEGKWFFKDPKIGDWFVTEDYGMYEGNILTILGREKHFIKIGGENVNISYLQDVLENVQIEIGSFFESVLFSMKEERLGEVIYLATTTREPEKLVNLFNDRVMPYERIRGVKVFNSIPKTSIGKIDYMKLIEITI